MHRIVEVQHVNDVVVEEIKRHNKWNWRYANGDFKIRRRIIDRLEGTIE